MEDSKIIELYFQRDEQAITETKDKYGKLLLSISKSILSSESDSQECLSDTLLQAWNTIPPKNPPSLMAYCAKIARNLSLNKLKFLNAEKRGAGAFNSVIDDLSDMLPSKENIEARLDAGILSAHINYFLATLQKEQRMIFVKRYWYFRSVSEIARELDISTTKVTTSLHRTRQKLRDYLVKEGYDI